MTEEELDAELREMGIDPDELVDDCMQEVTAFLLENKVDNPAAREFIRQAMERAERRLHPSHAAN